MGCFLYVCGHPGIRRVRRLETVYPAAVVRARLDHEAGDCAATVDEPYARRFAARRPRPETAALQTLQVCPFLCLVWQRTDSARSPYIRNTIPAKSL